MPARLPGQGPRAYPELLREILTPRRWHGGRVVIAITTRNQADASRCPQERENPGGSPA
jgi:hypothetical protein